MKRRILLAALLFVTLGLSACLTGAGTGTAPTGGAVDAPAAGFSGAPGSGTLFAAKGAGGEDTMSPRSELTDGLQGGELEWIGYRVFLSPKPTNTQEPSEPIPGAVEAKGVLNLKLSAQGALKAWNDATQAWSDVGWMTFGIGPYLRVVRQSSSGAAVQYQDQMLLNVETAGTGYNGVIKDLPVAEGDTVSLYIFDQTDPKGTSAEEYFVKPPDFSASLTTFGDGGLAAFSSNPKTHLLLTFSITTPPPAMQRQIMRPAGLPDFSDYGVK
ncbi:MAG TPA: hypothetical protein VFX30_02535 [bacterium]|nr:hypothetical protein [bacterium]